MLIISVLVYIIVGTIIVELNDYYVVIYTQAKEKTLYSYKYSDTAL